VLADSYHITYKIDMVRTGTLLLGDCTKHCKHEDWNLLAFTPTIAPREQQIIDGRKIIYQRSCLKKRRGGTLMPIPNHVLSFF